jgi:hypothetical protein
MTKQDHRVFPVIYSFEGHPSADGSLFLIEGTGFDGTVVRLGIPVDNIQHFIAFLLNWVGTIGGAQPSDAGAGESEGSGCIPIPATSIGIGHAKGDQAFIGISVGRAELVFALPASALTSVGQSLMLAGTPSNGAMS